MSDSQQTQVISSGVDALITRLRDEGVTEGKKKADKIVQDAEKKARATLEAAESEARQRVEVAQREADTLKHAGEEALRVAMRDLILELKAGLMRHFSSEVQRLVREQMLDKEFLRRMILELVGRMRDSMAIEEGEAVEVILPTEVIGLGDLRQRPDQLAEGDLSSFIYGVEGEILRKGLHFRPSDDPQVGVTVRLVEKDIKIDVTDKACAALLLDHLQPRFRAIMEGVVK